MGDTQRPLHNHFRLGGDQVQRDRRESSLVLLEQDFPNAENKYSHISIKIILQFCYSGVFRSLFVTKRAEYIKDFKIKFLAIFTALLFVMDHQIWGDFSHVPISLFPPFLHPL